MNFSEAFEPFQERLHQLSRAEALLWRLRDSLYNSLFYELAGQHSFKRHLFGYSSWIASLLRKIVGSMCQSMPMPTFQPTNFGFLFYGSHDAHFATLLPIVQEVAKEQPTTIWWMALTDKQVRALANIDNVTCINVGLWNTCRGYSVTFTTFASLFRSWRLQRMFEHFSELLPHEKALAHLKRSEIAETIFDYLRWKNIWRSVAPSLPKIAVFLTSESAPIAKGLRDVMREFDRRVIHFLHGLPNATHQVTYSTDLCVFSNRQAEWFRQRVGENVRVRTIGNPRLESIRSIVPSAPTRRPNERKNLLFFSQPPGDSYTRELRRDDLRIIGSNSDAFDLFFFRVRPHPTESLPLLKEDLKSAGLNNCELSTSSLTEDLAWCDVAATAFSTALLEAAICGRVCYWIHTGSYALFSMTELCDQGIGKWIRNAGDWNEELNRFRLSQVASPAVVTEALLRQSNILGETQRTWLSRLSFERTIPRH